MTEKPTGVFVRLPNDATAPQWAKAYDAVVGDEGTKKAALWDFIQIAKAIGTPVTSEELYPVGYINEDAIGGLACGIYQSASIFRDEDSEHHDDVALTRMSVALAKLAEKDAEIARLNDELSVYRAGMSELIAKEVTLLRGGAA